MESRNSSQPVVSLLRTENLPLTSLRGVAAVMVMLFHYRWAFADTQPFNYRLFEIKWLTQGYLWVDLFFILSGFVLCQRYFLKSSVDFVEYGRFITKRIARIFPLNFFALGLFVLFIVWTRDWNYVLSEWRSLLANAALVHSWGHLFAENWNTPSWSLSTEWGVYLLFPVLVALQKPLSNSWVRNIAGIVSAWAALHWLSVSIYKGSLDITLVHGIWRCLIGAWVGICLARLAPYVSEKFADIGASLSVVALFVMLQMNAPDIVFVPLSASTILFSAKACGYWKKALSWSPLIFLGRVSFSTYMLHGVIGRTLQEALKQAGITELELLPGAFAFLALCAFTVLVSYLSFRFIEEGAAKLFQRQKVERQPADPSEYSRAS